MSGLRLWDRWILMKWEFQNGKRMGPGMEIGFELKIEVLDVDGEENLIGV